MKIRAIIMDMDGTITKFNLDYMNARRRALEELEKMNLRSPDMTDQYSIYIILKMLKQRVDAETFRMLRRKFYGLVEEMELKAAEDVTLYPGVLSTLQKLKELCIKIGIVTNNGRKGTKMTLARHGLEKLFDAVVTRDDCEEMKPDIGPVLKVLDEMGVAPNEAILVGDGVIDIMAAKAAGLPSVAVGTGPFTSERLLKAEPDYLLSSINDLPTLIEQLDRIS